MNTETFFKQFELLADAPNGIAKLRELILQLAVQGKLVPQNPDDEPADVLLSRIKAEKERLVKEGKIKKSKKLPDIKQDEIPFMLPNGWVWERLGNLIMFIGGSQPPKSKFIYEQKSGYTRLIQIRDFKSDNFKTYVPNEFANRLFTEEEIMIGRYGPPVFQILRGLKGTYNVALMKAHPIHDSLINDYLYYLLQEPRIQKIVISESERTAGQSGVRKELLNFFVAALPPLSEQKRIVEKVDRLMELCDKLETQQQQQQTKTLQIGTVATSRLTAAKTPEAFKQHWQNISNNFDLIYSTPENIKQLRQTILQLAVMGKLVPQNPHDEPASVLLTKIKAEKEKLIKEGKIKKSKKLKAISPDEIPFDLPDSWGINRFGELADIIGGVTKGRKLAGKKTAFYPYLRVANVQRNYLDLQVIKEIEIPISELEKYRLKKNDILMTEGGDWDKLGRTTIWNDEIKDCIHQNHVFRARIIIEDLHFNWISLYTNSRSGRDYFEGAAKRTTNLASINMTQLKNSPIPIPPTSEQHRIVAKVNQLMTYCDELEAKLTQSLNDKEKLVDTAVYQILTA